MSNPCSPVSHSPLVYWSQPRSSKLPAAAAAAVAAAAAAAVRWPYDLLLLVLLLPLLLLCSPHQETAGSQHSACMIEGGGARGAECWCVSVDREHRT
jgi:hypothetical protein